MKYTLSIEQDTDPLNPRKEYDNVGVMVCFHRRYDLGDDKHGLKSSDFNNWPELENFLIKKRGAAVILPLYLYDHSGLTIATTPFSCPWDSGQVGFIYCTREAILQGWGGKRLTKPLRQIAANCLRGEVETYDQYLRGDVWGYEIKDEDDEVVDSCWGFYGEEYCQQEGEVALKALNET
jgi:hypothetical protein